jgi:hypothetical protein
MPYKGTDRDMKNSGPDNCLDTLEHICRTRVSEKSPSVERRSSALYASATPFLSNGGNEWLKSTADLKSKTVLSLFNMLEPFKLPNYQKRLTGQ